MPSAAIELGAADGDERRRAIPLRDGATASSSRRCSSRAGLPAESDRAAARTGRPGAGGAGRDRAAAATRCRPRRSRPRRCGASRRAQDRAAAGRVARPANAADRDRRGRPRARRVLADRGGAHRAERRGRRRGRSGSRRSIDKLLDLSRLQAGQRRAAPRLGLARGGDARRARGQAAGGEVRLAIDPDVPALRADAAQLERAFANLLENARRYSSGAAGVTSTSGAIGQRGGGPRRRSRAGDPPRRAASGSSSRSTADAARPRPLDRLGPRPRDREGVRRGQRRHDLGRVAPRPGHELRRSSLPGPEDADAGRRRERSGAAPEGARVRRRAADPARAAGDPARCRLRGAARRDGEEALDVAAVRRPDAAIIDLVLPDGDGVEVCRRLREWSRDADHRPVRGRRGGRQGPRARGRGRRLRDQAVRAARAGRAAARRTCAATAPDPRRP